jgi:hypothetical protein
LEPGVDRVADRIADRVAEGTADRAAEEEAEEAAEQGAEGAADGAVEPGVKISRIRDWLDEAHNLLMLRWLFPSVYFVESYPCLS